MNYIYQMIQEARAEWNLTGAEGQAIKAKLDVIAIDDTRMGDIAAECEPFDFEKFEYLVVELNY